MENTIKIETILGKDILFNKQTERFIVDDSEYTSLFEAKKRIKKDKEAEFIGEFFIQDRWDGIVRFTAQRKIYDEYEGKYKIIGKLHKSIGNDRGEVEEKDLFPINEYNEQQEKRAKEMDREGWSLIHQAKQLPLRK